MHDPVDHDRQFEAYLKAFHPVAPAPLPIPARSGKVFALLCAAALAAGVAAVLLVTPQFRHVRVDPAQVRPLTVRSANALLAQASSWDEVIDDARLAFRPAVNRTEPDRRSVLEILSQENLSK